jgi:hypothetical protein
MLLDLSPDDHERTARLRNHLAFPRETVDARPQAL